MADQVYLRLSNNHAYSPDDDSDLPEEYYDFTFMRDVMHCMDYNVFMSQPEFWLDMVREFTIAEQRAKEKREGNKMD